MKFDITKLRAHFGELGGDNGWINLAEVVLYGPVSEEQEPVVQPAVKVDALEGESVTKDWTAEDYTTRVTIPAHTGCQQGPEKAPRWMNGVAYTNEADKTFEDNFLECKDPSHWNLVVDLQETRHLIGFKLYSPDKVVNAPNEDDVWVDVNDGPICDVAFYGKNAEGDDWVKFATFTGNTDNELTAQFAEAVDYRYVKFEITKIRANQDTLNSSDRWFNVAELELYGTQE